MTCTECEDAIDQGGSTYDVRVDLARVEITGCQTHVNMIKEALRMFFR